MNIPNFLVDVRCFTFNQSKFIIETMDGFCMQKTDFPFVCLIVDDASTDGEQEVISNYVKNKFECSDSSEAYQIETDYASITYARHRNNSNCYFVVLFLKENLYTRVSLKLKYLAKWRNNCKYEALCEGDDYWIDPYKLQKQVDFLESHPDFDMIRTDCNVYYQDTNITINSAFGKKIFPNCEDTFVDYVVRPAWLATCSWLIRSPLGDYDNLPNDCFKGDLALMIYIAKRSKVKYLPEVTSVYRVLKNSASHFSDSADNIRFWKSQVNTRCYYSCYLSLFDKIVLTKNILSVGRHFYINRRTFDIRSFLYLSMDIISRVFLQNQ